MCRLALMNKPGVQIMQRLYGLDNFLSYLERQMGGHGNGYALIKDGECIDLRKGVALKTRQIASTALKTDFDWFIFHTRLASCGTIADRNCHPFQNPSTGDILAANGTESDLSYYNKMNNLDRTDTETLLLDFLNEGNFLYDLKVSRSTLIGAHKGKVFAVRNQGSLMKLGFTNDVVVLASAFPKEIGVLAYPCASYFEPGFND